MKTFTLAITPLAEVLRQLVSGRGALRTRWGSWLTVTLALVVAKPTATQAQISTVLTDKIYQGSGTIDLFKDLTSSQLKQYLSGTGTFLLGADINENASGNETSNSIGVAIKQLELVIKTSQGRFTFSDFFTGTTALIQEAGATSRSEYYTLFGQTGSSQITSSTTGFDLSKYDDVIEIRNVAVAGEILGAQLNFTFLNTAKLKGDNNESFFDFSGGFEDFALLSRPDAQVLESANIGQSGASGSVTFTQSPTVPGSTTTDPTPTPTPTPAPTPAPGAPAPPAVLLVALGLGVLFRGRRHAR